MANIPVSTAIDNLLKSTPSTTVTTAAALTALGAATTGTASIVAADLAANAVTTAKILDANVTAAKLATNAVDLTTSTVTGTLPVNKGGTGAATLTANNVLIGAGTSAPTFVAPSTSGNVLTSNGTTWTSSAPTGILDDRLASYRMGSWRSTLNDTTAPVIAVNGDSMLANAAQQLSNIIRARLGFSGYAFTPFAAANSAVTKEDPTTWFLYNSVVLSSTNHTAEISSVSGTAPIAADTIKVYYATKVDGGSFKLQTKIGNLDWVDETDTRTNGITNDGSPNISFSSSSSIIPPVGMIITGTGIPADTFVVSATANTAVLSKNATATNTGLTFTFPATVPTADTGGTFGKVITLSKAGWRKTYSVRAVWVSGNVDMIGGGLYLASETGARFAYLSAGGYAGNLSDWVTQNTAISNPIFNDIGLDLVILSHLDGASGVNTHQATWQNLINQAGVKGISNITSTASQLTVNTSVPHGLTAGDFVKMSGTSIAGYNNIFFIIKTITDADTFIIDIVSALNLGTATGGTVVREPSWICIGPPASSDATQHSNNAAQAAAMRTLALSRGDAFWDNKEWAGTSAQAIANGYCSVTDSSHYTTLGINQWVARMVSETSLFESQTRRPEEYFPSFGAKLRRYRLAGLTGSPATNEHQGVLRICNPDGVTGKSMLIIEPETPVAGTTYNIGITLSCDENAVGTIGYIGGYIWRFRQNVGSGALFYQPNSTATTPDGVLGIVANPIREINLGKTINQNTISGNVTIDKVCGRVWFDTGASTITVTNARCTVDSVIMATVLGNDATATSVRVTTISAGSFILTLNANATAKTAVNFWVVP